ncbi:MAG: hypothetical protein ABIR62_01655 [Dokdonella sp.]|uniref:hypothetical protein n=1 Tax=Dokdonella sp. TaxID=2291710 RepID=UPI0032663BEB
MTTLRSPLLSMLLTLATLAGCVETRFESPLGDNIETCDARWKGLWLPTDAERAKNGDDATAFHINDDCEFTVIEQPEKGDPLKRLHVPINYVHANGNDYIVVAESAVKGLVSLNPPHAIDPAPDKDYFFARYRVRGDRIEVFAVDSTKVAKLVVDGKVDGTVDKRANELHVFVRGNRARMLELVRHESIFEDTSSLQMQRSRLSLADFEKSLVPVHSPGTDLRKRP